MATVRHLGPFSKRWARCPSYNLQENLLLAGAYPQIWMPPEYALAMYWRVKKWRFNFEIDWAETNAADAAWNWSVSREFTAGQSSVLVEESIEGGGLAVVSDITSDELSKDTTEKKLVCGVDASSYEETVTPDFGDPYILETVIDAHFDCAVRGINVKASSGTFAGSAGTSVGADIQWDWGNRTAAYVRTNQTTGKLEMLPTIYFEATTFRWIRILAFDWTIPSTLLPQGQYGEFSYVLLGQTFTAPVYAYNERASVGGFTNTLDVVASLEAIEYWPYDPGDGLGPIYDSTTGAQLRPFPG